MIRHEVSTFALIAAAALALGACNTNDGRSPAAQPAGQIQGSNAAPTDQTEAAPFVLTLTGPATLPTSGEATIVATITSERGFAAPATLSLIVPKNAVLSEGAATENLPSVPAGETKRSFKLNFQGGASTPVRVVIDARSPDGVMGAHAERQLPEEAAFQYNRPTNVPPPPVSRPIGHPPAQ